jgi:hypothetical protein
MSSELTTLIIQQITDLILWSGVGALLGLVLGVAASWFGLRILKTMDAFNVRGPHCVWPKRIVGICWFAVNPPALSFMFAFAFVLIPTNTLFEHEESDHKLGIETSRLLVEQGLLNMAPISPAEKEGLRKSLKAEEGIELESVPFLIDAVIQSAEPSTVCAGIEGIEQKECMDMVSSLDLQLDADQLKQAALAQMGLLDINNDGMMGTEELGIALSKAAAPQLRRICTQFITSQILGTGLVFFLWICATIGFWFAAAKLTRDKYPEDSNAPKENLGLE